ncbi:MAG: hypothetical protein ACXWF0_18745, partial [Usitatibacter sp.]
MKLSLLLALAAICAGCATAPKHVAPELFAVVPGANGHVGAIVVHSEGNTRVINSAYGAERIRSDGTLEPGKVSESEVR